MLIINIDRTIESLLNKYLARCAKVLDNKRKSFTKKKSVKQEELDAYNASLASYEFLAKIAKNCHYREVASFLPHPPILSVKAHYVFP